MVLLLILVVLLLMSVGGLPAWGWHHYGYYPSGFTMLLFVVVVALLVRSRNDV